MYHKCRDKPGESMWSSEVLDINAYREKTTGPVRSSQILVCYTNEVKKIFLTSLVQYTHQFQRY